MNKLFQGYEYGKIKGFMREGCARTNQKPLVKTNEKPLETVKIRSEPNWKILRNHNSKIIYLEKFLPCQESQ